MVAVAVLLATVHVAALHPDFVSLFQSHEFHYSGGGYKGQLFRYRLFVPEQTEEELPLIVWLHGFGENGQDNTYLLKWLDQLIFHPPKRDRYPFYLLAVQCPSDNPYWTTNSSKQDDMIEVAAAILERTLKQHPIDRRRVYLSGVSSGGAGCWEFALRRPELFAAVAPLASSCDVAGLEKMSDVPVWAFHSKDDGGTPVQGVRRAVETLREAGGTAHLTEIDSNQHDCWTAAFGEHKLLDWLLAQRRGERSTPPGKIPLAAWWRELSSGWQWWQVLLQIGIPALFAALAWQAMQRRRTSRPVSRVGLN